MLYQIQRDAKTQDPDKVTKANKISREACKMQWTTWKASRAERLNRANGFRVGLDTDGFCTNDHFHEYTH